VPGLQKPAGILVVVVRVALEEPEGADGHGRIHVDRDGRDAVRARQFVQEVDQLLGPLDRKGRNDDHAPPLDPRADQVPQVLGHGVVPVDAIPVGGLQDQPVSLLERFGVAQDGRILAAQVAREDQTPDGVRGEGQLNAGRAQDVPGIPEACPDPRHDLEGLGIAVGLELTQAGLGIGPGVQGQGRVVPGGGVPVGIGGLFLLDESRIRQQQRAQIPGAARGVDGTGETVAADQRQITRVIDVRVGDQHGFDRNRWHGEGVPVAQAQLLGSLEQATVHHETMPLPLQQIARTGHRAGSSQEPQSNHRWPRAS